MRASPVRVITILVILVIVAVAAYLIYRQLNLQPTKEPLMSDTPDQAAQQSLDTLRRLVTTDNYQVMGFNALNEAQTAQLGDPMMVYRVQLDQLLAYESQSESEADPNSLLVDVNRKMYPVTFNGEVRSSIGVEGQAGGWTATDFGGPNLIKALAQYRRSPDDFVVQIAFLGLYFVGERSDDGLLLTPITDDPRFEFKAGEPMQAAEVFQVILPAAKEYNGDPI